MLEYVLTYRSSITFDLGQLWGIDISHQHREAFPFDVVREGEGFSTLQQLRSPWLGFLLPYRPHMKSEDGWLLLVRQIPTENISRLVQDSVYTSGKRYSYEAATIRLRYMAHFYSKRLNVRLIKWMTALNQLTSFPKGAKSASKLCKFLFKWRTLARSRPRSSVRRFCFS